MEFLRKLFAEGESLTFDQLKAKIEADTGLKIINLMDGGYVSKQKLDDKITELSGVKQQLTDAHAEIQSYKDMDIDGIKKSAADWEQKYKADTQALQDKLAAQQTEFAARTYLSGFKFANPLVEEAIYNKFMEKKFAMEGDKFLGADDFMAEMQKQNPTAFITENPAPQPNPNPVPAPAPTPKPNPAPRPWFAPQTPPAPPAKKRTLKEMMQFHNEHPDAPINFDA